MLELLKTKQNKQRRKKQKTKNLGLNLGFASF